MAFTPLESSVASSSVLLLAVDLGAPRIHIKYIFNMFFPLGHKQRVPAVSLC